jgi:uncharacterized ion transporter superfamily protein YfcC
MLFRIIVEFQNATKRYKTPVRLYVPLYTLPSTEPTRAVFVRRSKFIFSVIVFHLVIIEWLVLNFAQHHPNHSTQFLIIAVVPCVIHIHNSHPQQSWVTRVI